MVNMRSYNLLCPISRALDHVGDRWSLLILRDLHAGPARFKDLQTGLTGIASNLLAGRLLALEASGLVQKGTSDFGVSIYSLTQQGKKTNQLIFELAKFGRKMPHPPAIKKPGNLRTIAVSLGTACDRAANSDHNFVANLIIDGEVFQLVAKEGKAAIHAGEAEIPDVALTASYEAIIALADGVLDRGKFVSEHAKLEVFRVGKEREFFDLLARGIKEFD